jgi:hypothetical protein
MTGPRRISDPPKDYLEANSPPRVWATLTDGERMVIDGPRVISDTVFGWAQGEEVVIPTDQLQEIRVRQFSLLKSSIVPTLALGSVIAIWVLLKKDPGLPELPDTTQENESRRSLDQ